MTDTPLPEVAIAAALAQNWKEAIKINTAILKQNKTDIDALNRLGFAYLQSGQFTSAKKMFQKVLKIDPYNQIASRNSKKLTSIKRKDLVRTTGGKLSPLMFLEEPGKTKIVVCVNPAPKNVLSTLVAGQEVQLKARNHAVEVRDERNAYLGVLPDDLSFKLIKFLAGGNRYQTLIKGVGKNTLTVFLRETARGKRFAHQPSFITTTSFLPFSRAHAGEGPDMTPTGEDAQTDAEAVEEV